MIKIESKKNKFTYNVYHVTKAFYPKEDIVQTVDEKQEPLVKIHLPEGTCFSLAPEECVQTEDVQEEKRDVTKKVYQFLSKQTGQELPGECDRSPSNKACNAENRAGNDKRRNLWISKRTILCHR